MQDDDTLLHSIKLTRGMPDIGATAAHRAIATTQMLTAAYYMLDAGHAKQICNQLHTRNLTWAMQDRDANSSTLHTHVVPGMQNIGVLQTVNLLSGMLQHLCICGL